MTKNVGVLRLGVGEKRGVVVWNTNNSRFLEEVNELPDGPLLMRKKLMWILEWFEIEKASSRDVSDNWRKLNAILDLMGF
ncbi:hypothetical protein CEXT_328091 [Caerostris extrusa]|uniref:Uncharacterized protein n=1 Tax=Caerostris extrusa TaxID=172846 RepID=A0AAV4Q7N2_CAEEX|nr:hypothetical protein CEXT_328091 [Caerostris extrusa]